MPIISVIIPVYNTEKYLQRCLDSVLSQTFIDYELILVDDGSKDKSGNLCDQNAQRDNRIRVFHQKNQGQAAARNYGVSQARGKWICFIDSDDVIHPQMLEALYNAIQIHKVKISVCGSLEAESISEDFYQKRKSDSSKVVIDENTMMQIRAQEGEQHYTYWCIWAKLIDKQLIMDNPFTVGRIYEDSAVMCKWLYYSREIAVVHDIFYFYQYNLTGTMHGSASVKKLDELWSAEEQQRFFRKIGYKKLDKDLVRGYVKYAVLIYDELAGYHEYNRQLRQLRKKILGKIIQNRNYWSLKEQIAVLEHFYPRILNVYWTATGVQKKLREEGIAGVWTGIWKHWNK